MRAHYLRRWWWLSRNLSDEGVTLVFGIRIPSSPPNEAEHAPADVGTPCGQTFGSHKLEVNLIRLLAADGLELTVNGEVASVAIQVVVDAGSTLRLAEGLHHTLQPSGDALSIEDKAFGNRDDGVEGSAIHGKGSEEPQCLRVRSFGDVLDAEVCDEGGFVHA